MGIWDLRRGKFYVFFYSKRKNRYSRKIMKFGIQNSNFLFYFFGKLLIREIKTKKSLFEKDRGIWNLEFTFSLLLFFFLLFLENYLYKLLIREIKRKKLERSYLRNGNLRFKKKKISHFFLFKKSLFERSWNL